MSKVKGTDIVHLKKYLQDKGHFLEERLLSKLDLSVVNLYQNVMHTTWAPVDQMVLIYTAAAEVLFPDDPHRLVKIGKMLAERSFESVYKIFLRNPDLDSLISRIGMIWKAYHVQGSLTARKLKADTLELVVTGYPELPAQMRYIMNGHFAFLLEKAGGRNISVTNQDTNPEAWCWRLIWS